MFDFLQYEFMRNALEAAVLASVACGVIGTFVVVRRIALISGGIAHAAFGGIGLGYFLGINPLWCLLPFSLASALGIGWIHKRFQLAEDTIIGIFWAMGMSLGVILIGMTPGYAPNLFSYLFGNILTVPQSDVLFMLALDVFILLVVMSMYKEFQAVSFDEEYAAVAGVNVSLFYFLLLMLIAFTVVVLVRIVGIILVIALLTIPAAIARQYTRRLSRMMVVSVAVAMALTIGGVWLSYLWDTASGATTILFSGVVFLLSSVIRMGVQRSHPA